MDFLSEFRINASSGNYYYLFYMVALITLLILLKGRRVKFVVPATIISFVVLNPIVYKVWMNQDLYAYWRVFWVIPVIPICASFPSVIAERIKNNALKIIVGLFLVCIFIPLGSFIYTSGEGKFDLPSKNYSKLPESSVAVAIKLLELDDNPKVVAVPDVSVYIRQFSGKIDTLYGRDIFGYIDGSYPYADQVNCEISSEDGDFDYVAKVMLDEGYDYLVIPSVTDYKYACLGKAGFEWKENVAGYDIYQIHGTPTIIKERNELGQVVREIAVDEHGNPTDGEMGFSTTEYSYDGDGNRSEEIHITSSGKPYIDINGISGYKRQFDRYGRCISEKYLDENNKAINLASTGHAETKYKFKGKNLVEESYYDKYGNSVVRTDLLYSAHRITYKDNCIVKESYYDENDKLTLVFGGYSTVKRKYNMDDLLIEEKYYGKDNNLIVITKGYAGFEREYDNKGNCITEKYVGEDGKLCSIPAGYAIVRKEYDENNNIIKESYYDEGERPISSIKGCASIIREYDDSNRLIKERYFDASGEPFITPGGFCGIKQEYYEDGELYSREYLNEDGQDMERTDGYSKVIWEKSKVIENSTDEKNDVKEDEFMINVVFFDLEGNEVSYDGINLIKDGPTDWSEWMTPDINVLNSCFYVGNVNLGKKAEDNWYTCQLEIEFDDVASFEDKSFRFQSQGPVDGEWNKYSFWNSNVVFLDEPPRNGVYYYSYTFKLEEESADSNCYELGFRCDNWKSGRFRVKNVKVEKGTQPSEWDQGL